MAEPSDWNAGIIEEFRANGGRVGGYFEGATLLILHTRGVKTGLPRPKPLVYLPDESDDDSIYIFASKGGAPVNPEWYRNLMAAGQATIEVRTSTYPVTVSELIGEERDRVYAEQVTHMPGFGDYERKAEGSRKIPVLRLTRS